MFLSLGLMSGTSMDGIDAALLETDGTAQNLKMLESIFLPYNSTFKILLKAAEYSVRKYSGNLKFAAAHFEQDVPIFLQQEFSLSADEIPEQLLQLRNLNLDDVIQHSTYLHGLAANQLLVKAGRQASDIHVVGYHGQTLYHQPRQKISVIVGNGQQLADNLKIKVVNDFRSRDISHGGEGAPFAPLYHFALAKRDNKIPSAIVNCGGIANITLISSENEQSLVAYDTGPGNGLIDRLVKQRTKGQQSMDKDGQYGAKGKISEQLIADLYASAIIKNNQNYFLLPPPKSLDIGDLQLIPQLADLSLEDACATLEAFTADAIVSSLDLLDVNPPKRWILAGGGWYNPIILRELRTRLQKRLKTDPEIHTAEYCGWSSQAMEAQIFAYLAIRSLQNQPLSLPGTTGISEPLSGGTLYCPYGIT